MTLNWNMRQGISATLWIYRRRVLVARKQIVQIELLCCLLLHSQGICWHITLYALPHLMPRLLLHLFCSASFFTLVARLFLLVSLICFVLQLPQFSCLCLTLQSPLPPSFTALPLLCPAHTNPVRKSRHFRVVRWLVRDLHIVFGSKLIYCCLCCCCCGNWMEYFSNGISWVCLIWICIYSICR